MTALPETVTRVLNEFLEAAKAAHGTDLEAAVLFGSAAEGRLRPASDVNLILVLARFQPEAAAALAPQLRFAESAIKLRVMFLLGQEIPAAANTFAQKFSDIAKRRQVLHGSDPFAGIAPPREALQRQVEQVLLNLAIRLRERASSVWGQEDLLARALADAVGPIRACAQSIVELGGGSAESPKAALAALLGTADAPHPHLAAYYSRLRERSPEPGSAGKTLMETMELIAWMRKRNI
jgi:predicted nucleotidyltransferase